MDTTQKLLDYLELVGSASLLCDQICPIYEQSLAEAKAQALSKAVEILRPTVEALLLGANTDSLIKDLAEQMMPTGLG